MSDPTIEQDAVERARLQIRRLVEEIRACSDQDLKAPAYYAAFLPRVVEALAAVGGAVWQPQGHGSLQLVHQVNLKSTLLDHEGEHQRRHALLISQVVRSNSGMLVAPHAGSGNESQGANPTEMLLVLAPVANEAGVQAVVEIFQRPTTQADIRQGYLSFLSQMCALASGWSVRRERAAGQLQTAQWQKLTGFVKQIHGRLDATKTAYIIANEAQRFIECDRVGVALQRKGRCRLVSVSGHEQVEQRSDSVQTLQRLVDAVMKYGEPFWYPVGGALPLPPQLEQAAEDYLEVSFVKTIGILPLHQPTDSQERTEEIRSETIFGALVLEQIEDERAQQALNAEASLLVPHVELALSAALQHEDLFLMPLLRRLGNARKLVTGRWRTKSIAVALLLGVLLSVLIFVPAPFSMQAPGLLQPHERRDVFVMTDGLVSAVHVEHGDKVAAGQLLLELQNPDLEVQLAQAQGQLHETTERLLAAERLRHQGGLAKDEQNRLAGEVLSLEQQIRSLEQQCTLLKAKQKRLRITSPMAGQVVTWNVRRTLLQRPVSAGQVVLSLANPAGDWELEVFMPEERMGHLAAYQSEHPGPMDVEFVTATEPSQVNHGTTREIHSLAELHEEHGHSVSLLVDIDKSSVKDPRPGLTVTAHVKCGSRSLGYVWLHEVWEFVQTKILFNLW